MRTGTRTTMRFVQEENVRLREENDRLRDEVSSLHLVLDSLRALYDIQSEIDEGTDLLDLLNHILVRALGTIGATDGSLLLRDEETGDLVFVVVHGSLGHRLLHHRIGADEGVAGWVATNRRPAVVLNPQYDARFSRSVDQTFQFETNSLICVPIIGNNEVCGVIQALNKQQGAFNRDDLSLLGVVAQLAANALLKADAVLPQPEPVPA